MTTPASTAMLQNLLEDHGLRATQPRLRLLEFFALTRGHFTPEEISEQLREQGQPISIATLYQNLKTFSDRGLVKEMIGHGGEVRYDTNLDPHSHLVCLNCGQLTDIHLDLQELHPPSQASGWLITQARVDLQGLCPGCQKRN
ncbi:Fur family transcriptional regulator [Deinococcus deserti]|uniref:Putative Ferric uptake regulator n=1 Tax=Deinococcus deserti (strain DSM 17065 / CIP 109153 / LMG 22923 / VCD115) TaxID=546414 RepID=C1D2Q0_DEIDV|nr:Fur family transcriptional regulator [Deinococcus deserti]ACO47689.1 putative Ferric uptake regulator [Deinococcus deserti VCD115]